MTDIFLSYSREDKATAQQYAEALQREGFLVWWDQTLRSGEAYDEVTETRLREARAIVVLWSKHSVQSRWVRAEATVGERNHTLLPVMIEDCMRPVMFELTQSAELMHWHGNRSDPAWQTFVDDLRNFLAKATADPAVAQSAPTIAAPARRRWPIRTSLVISLAASLLLALVSIAFSLLDRQYTEALLLGSATTANKKISIAVLPFQDYSESKDQEYLADGLTEEILNSLAQLSELQVAGRTSSSSFKGKNLNLREIGETLNVENILEGSIRRQGNDLRVTVQFNNARTGFHYWSKTLNYQVTDIFKLQQDIAESVAESLQISLQFGCSVCPGMTHSVEAWDEYRKADKMDFNSLPGVNEMIQHLEKAIRIDPDFGMAWMNLFFAYNTAVNISPTNLEFQTKKRDEAFAQVTKLMPNAPMIKQRKALTAIEQQGWVEGERLLRESIPANYSDSLNAKLNIANFQMRLGFVKSAIGYFEQAKVTEPLSAGISISLALLYAYDGNFEASLQENARGIEKINQERLMMHGNALLTSLASGNKAAINTWVNRLTNANIPGNIPFSVQMTQMLDQPQQALEVLREFALSPGNNSFLTHLLVAQWSAHYGDQQLALEQLQASSKMTSRATVSYYALWHPIFREVRKLEGFKTIVTDLGMVDYWRSTGNWGDFCKPNGDTDFVCH